jgi:ribosomal protein S18 acetylase RimI-like enzyme
MEFIELDSLNEKWLTDYSLVVNSVIGKDKSSIGFRQKFDLKYAKQFLEEILNKDRSFIVLVYENNQIVGTGMFYSFQYNTPHLCLIKGLIVLPHLQRKGYGGKILKYLEEKAKEHEYSDILLNPWDFKEQINFYLKNNYKKVGVFPHFIKDLNEKYHDSTFFHKKIGNY